MGRLRLAAGLGLFASLACKSRGETEREAPTVPVVVARDAGAADPTDAAAAWPELDGLPRIEPLRVVAVPARPDVPRFDVGGPVIDRDLAVVSSSQFGFAAIDWRRGALRWTKPAGEHVAPPLAREGSFVLIGSCLTPPDVPAGHALLGCMRMVTADGADEAYLAVHGRATAVGPFAASAGAQEVSVDGDRAVRWRRGDAAVSIDVVTGVAKAARGGPSPIVVAYKDRRWDVTHEDDKVVARAKGKIAWRTEHDVAALLGPVWLPGQSPMIRVAGVAAAGGTPQIRLLDIDATGSGHGQAAWTAVPGIGFLGTAISPVGDVALAIRLDRSIERDYLAAFAANALLIWVYPLPRVPRADPIGVAIALDEERAPEAVVAFHDGDTLTILPPLSSPPTAPGAARAPLENPTP